MNSDVQQEHETQLRQVGSTHRQYAAAFLASLLPFCVGMDMGWSSPMQPLLTSSHPPVGSEPFTLEDMSWLTSISFLGAVIGTLFWGRLADRFGRKYTACLVAIPHIVSWIVVLGAQNFSWLLIARFIVGIGNSGTSISISVFITEIAQDDLRGFLGCFLKIFLNAGILYSYVMGTFLSYHKMAICCLVIPVVFLLLFVWFPETPLFYWKNGEPDKARKALLWYRCGDVYATEKTLQSYKSIQDKKTKQSLRFLVSTKGRTKALLIGVALAFAYQTTGIYTIIHYAVRIFQVTGTSFSSYYSAITVAVFQLVFSVFSSFLIDRNGRKFLFVASLVPIGISLVVLGTYLNLFQGTKHPILDLVPLISLSVHIVAFSLGYGPVFFVYKSEIFPPEIRGLAVSVTTLVSVGLSFFSLKLLPTLEKYLKLGGVFWFYGFMSLLFAVFAALFLIETKGRAQSVILKVFNNEELTPEEIELEAPLQGKKRSAHGLGNTAPVNI